MNRAYNTTAGSWFEVDTQNVPRRRRTRSCGDCRVEMEQRDGWSWCPSCGRTADEMGQVPR